MVGKFDIGPLLQVGAAEKRRFARYFAGIDISFEGVPMLHILFENALTILSFKLLKKKEIYLELMYDVAIDAIGSLRFHDYKLRKCSPSRRMAEIEPCLRWDLFAHAVDPTPETPSEDEDQGDDIDTWEDAKLPEMQKGKRKAKAKAKANEMGKAKERKTYLEGGPPPSMPPNVFIPFNFLCEH